MKNRTQIMMVLVSSVESMSRDEIFSRMVETGTYINSAMDRNFFDSYFDSMVYAGWVNEASEGRFIYNFNRLVDLFDSVALDRPLA
jgi:hypothetical protein